MVAIGHDLSCLILNMICHSCSEYDLPWLLLNMICHGWYWSWFVIVDVEYDLWLLLLNLICPGCYWIWFDIVPTNHCIEMRLYTIILQDYKLWYECFSKVSQICYIYTMYSKLTEFSFWCIAVTHSFEYKVICYNNIWFSPIITWKYHT